LAQTTNQPEKLSHAYLAELRKQPPSVFDFLVRRLTHGDSINQVTKYLYSLKTNPSSFRTCRAQITALSKEIDGEVQVQRDSAEHRRALAEFNEAREAAMRAYVPEPNSPPKMTLQRFDSIMVRGVRDKLAEELLRGLWLIQQQRVDRMVDYEESQQTILPHGHYNIAELRNTIMDIAELEEKRRVPVELMESQPKVMSPAVAAVARMDDVDRNITRQIYTTVINMIEDASEEKSNVATNENVGTDGAGETKPNTDEPASDAGPPVTGSPQDDIGTTTQRTD
jgi:hypothetical protein